MDAHGKRGRYLGTFRLVGRTWRDVSTGAEVRLGGTSRGGSFQCYETDSGVYDVYRENIVLRRDNAERN